MESYGVKGKRYDMIDIMLFLFKFIRELFKSSDFTSSKFNIFSLMVYFLVGISVFINYYSVPALFRISSAHIKLMEEDKKHVSMEKENADLKLQIAGCKDVVTMFVPPDPDKQEPKRKNTDKSHHLGITNERRRN